MKLNKQGINIDEGLPLTTQEALDILHIELYPQQSAQLIQWLKSSNATQSIAVAGQIGCGKSTLINKCLLTSKITPDCTLKLDQDVNSQTQGDFIYIVIAALVATLDTQQITPQQSKPLIEDFSDICQIPITDWSELNNQLNPNKKSLQSIKQKSQIVTYIDSEPAITRYFLDAIQALIRDFCDQKSKAPLIFATGIDKYDSQKPAYFTLQPILDQLTQAKILYEINAIHLFAAIGKARFISNPLLLPTVEYEKIVNLLTKRLGIYAEKYHQQIASLAENSGGNPRQAIRLLMHFINQVKDRNLSVAEHLAVAIKKTSLDYFSFTQRPSTELIKTIEKDGFIHTATISRSGDIDTGQRAIYANWILLTQALEVDKHPCIINPIVKHQFEQIKPHDVLQQQLKLYAQQHNMNDIGLSIDPNSTNDYLKLSQQLDHFIDSNINAVLDDISASLLSKDRTDRIFITYSDKNEYEAARDYILAKSNEFQLQSFSHQFIAKETNIAPLVAIERLLTTIEQESIDILSIEFDTKWSIEQLSKLEAKRDNLINCQVIWWLPKQQLQSLLPHIPQLRQLFEVCSLDDELSSNLTIEQLQSDIELFDMIYEQTNTPAIEKLKNVAKYLTSKQESKNG